MNAMPNFPVLWLSIAAVMGGLAMLVGGGELMVSGAIRLAVRQGMSSLLIGLTVVAFGTSLPELFVSLNATLLGHVDIMIGNVVGSNIANIGLILGLSVLFAPIRIPFSKVRIEVYLVLAFSLLLAAIASQGEFSRLFGIIYVTALIVYTLFSYRAASRQKAAAADRALPAAVSFDPLWKILAFILGGLLLMAYGSNLFIAGAVDLARYFDISELVIGLTLAAIGTSLPELAASLAAFRRRQGELLLGNVLGSNLFNLMMVMGGTALVAPFAFNPLTLTRDLPVMLGFSLVLVPMLLIRRGLGRVDGLLLLGAYFLYLFSLR
jgi:cation:H+ antiporter